MRQWTRDTNHTEAEKVALMARLTLTGQTQVIMSGEDILVAESYVKTLGSQGFEPSLGQTP